MHTLLSQQLNGDTLGISADVALLDRTTYAVALALDLHISLTRTRAYDLHPRFTCAP